MRKLVALLVAGMLSLPALSPAQSWKQLSADMFVDDKNITRSFDAVHVNVKYILDKADAARLQKTLKSKEAPHSSVQRKNFSCNNRQVSTSSFTYYSASGAVLAQGTVPTQQKTDIVPESRIEVVYDFVCQQR